MRVMAPPGLVGDGSAILPGDVRRLVGFLDGLLRGRIVGDYRRIALYGIDFLIQEKKKDLEHCGNGAMFDDIIRQREEIAEQIRALKGIQEMAAIYGFDISRPASNAKEAVQWLYFGYLAAVKTQNGAAMSVGRVSTFLDIYINRDLTEQTLTEAEAQELIDHMTMKFRMVKLPGSHPTTNFSPAIRSGRRWRLLVWDKTGVRW